MTILFKGETKKTMMVKCLDNGKYETIAEDKWAKCIWPMCDVNTLPANGTGELTPCKSHNKLYLEKN